jgi:hypothetical protein
LLRCGHTGKGEKKEAPYQGGGHPSYVMRWRPTGSWVGGGLGRLVLNCSDLCRIVQGGGVALFSAEQSQFLVRLLESIV